MAIAAALLFAFGLLLFQVLVRYILPFPVAWLEEAATYLSRYMAMIGTSVCLRAGYHLQVDLLRDALPAAARHLLMFIQNVLVFSFCVFLVRYGIAFVELGAGQTGPSTFFYGQPCSHGHAYRRRTAQAEYPERFVADLIRFVEH